MPAFPSKEQIEYVGSQAAMLAVEHTAGQREALERLEQTGKARCPR